MIDNVTTNVVSTTVFKYLSSSFEDTNIQSTSSSSLSSSSTKVKSNKKGVNYASVTCGAKIIAVNPEAQNAVFVLMENKDQYMINPCKAKKQ